jgi:hypothetical protein
MAEAFVWLSPVVRERGDASRAAALAKHALGMILRFQDRRLFNMCTDTVLWLVGDTADPGQVARLIGVNEALHHITGLAHSVWKHTPFASVVSALGARLDDESVAAARTEGYALSMQQMAELAFEILDEVAEVGTVHVEPSGAIGTGRQAVLSPRELEVLRLVEEGYLDREIAGRLFITERTVRYHLHLQQARRRQPDAGRSPCEAVEPLVVVKSGDVVYNGRSFVVVVQAVQVCRAAVRIELAKKCRHESQPSTVACSPIRPASSAQIGRDSRGQERTESPHQPLTQWAHRSIAANDLLPTVFPPNVTNGRVVSSLG